MAAVSTSRIIQLGDELFDSLRSRSPLESLTDREPDLTLEHAYQIQEHVIGKRLALGDRIIGKKIGLTSRVVQRALGVSEPDFGQLLASMVATDTIALAALMQAIVFKLQKLRRDNITFRSYPRRLIDENRWRASRYGLDGKMIDFGRKCEVDERELLHEMLEFIAPEVDELGNHAEMAHIEKIMREGTGADRQLAVWERTRDMKAVVDQIVAETYQGLNL